MSVQSKFFDETTETILISKHGLMTKIRSLVELDAELHVVSMTKDVAGTFHVVWLNTKDRDGYYQMGLEVLEAEGDMWGLRFPDSTSAGDDQETRAWLECTRCHQKEIGAVPLAELEYLGQGVLVARGCEKCKATTPWAFAEASGEAPAAAPPAPESNVAPMPAGVVIGSFDPVFEPSSTTTRAPQRPTSADDRTRLRAPLKLKIKIIRDIYGTPIEDVCDTINVSRTGAYFLTSHNYNLGEIVQAVLLYKEGSMNLPVRAKVVRKDQQRGMFDHAVAIQTETAVYIPPPEEAAEPSASAKQKKEQRGRSRVPLKFPIKVIRNFHGQALEEITETINISRSGAYFQTMQHYTIGEVVQVILPYKPGDVPIPVPARVVRQDAMKDSVNHAVAIHMEKP